MSTTITHHGIDIEILVENETPMVHCREGDLFIRKDQDGFWVSLWDGEEALDLNTEPDGTLDDAISWAKECAEHVQ